MTVILPKPENESGTNEWADVFANDKALKEAVETLQTEFAAANNPVTWYTPKVIATEESRTNTSFGTLTTADEIKSVVLAENGLILISYTAIIKSSVSGAGGVAIFIGSNQLKSPGIVAAPEVQEASTTGTSSTMFISRGGGLVNLEAGTSYVTTGMTLGAAGTSSGLCPVFAAAGTYDISVKYKATSGSVTAKERKLWVETRG